MNDFIKAIEHIMNRVNRDKYDHNTMFDAQLDILREVLGEAERIKATKETE